MQIGVACGDSSSPAVGAADTSPREENSIFTNQQVGKECLIDSPPSCLTNTIAGFPTDLSAKKLGN